MTGYVLNFEVYTGEKEDVDLKQPAAMKTVLSLMKPYLGKGHSLFVDNYYTSPSLFYKLYQRQTNACGTVRSNRRGLPQFPKLKKHEICIRTLDENDVKLLAVKWSDKRDVFMLSSSHAGRWVTTKKKDRNTNEFIRKPLCVTEYNKFMGLVDKSNMQLSFNECNRKTTKWYKNSLFIFLI